LILFFQTFPGPGDGWGCGGVGDDFYSYGFDGMNMLCGLLYPIIRIQISHFHVFSWKSPASQPSAAPKGRRGRLSVGLDRCRDPVHAKRSASLLAVQELQCGRFLLPGHVAVGQSQASGHPFPHAKFTVFSNP
jgi:hypothetical protein